LSDKYTQMRIEKENAQAEALEIQRRANEELEQKVMERTVELNKQKDDIESSIKYAKRIQDVVLPEKDKVRNILPESFILYMPRDIVSGDFYWICDKDNKTIILTVDCTGHGVPGAFMSILGNNLLNEIINLRKITEPDIILKELHYAVRETLKQEYNQNRDGMDLSLCIVDKENNRLEFAGAKCPLIYIKDGKLHALKGDRLSIGGENSEKERMFKKHIIEVDSPISVYMFSDGYQDQFGGPKDKKFMFQRFKDLIFALHKLPMEAQRLNLMANILDWRKANYQVDDILVLGFKVLPYSLKKEISKEKILQTVS
jgi:serine phosphatase RsbU (regulator of sigma subunit)